MSDFVTYAEVVDGLHDRLLTIPDFPAYNDHGVLINLLKYEPSEIQHTPTIYTLLDGFERDNGSAQMTGMHYRILHRLLIQWQDNEQAELELMPFVHSVPAAIDQDRLLGGIVNLGSGATIKSAQSGFIIFSDIKFRCLDFIVSVSTKAPVRSGI